MVIPAVIAQEGAKKAVSGASALKGDIYAKKWKEKRRLPKKGSRPAQTVEVERELHINPVTGAIARGAAAAGAFALMAALWFSQQKLGSTQGADASVRVQVTEEKDKRRYTAQYRAHVSSHTAPKDSNALAEIGKEASKLMGKVKPYDWNSYAVRGSGMTYFVLFRSASKQRYGLQERKGFNPDIF